VGGEADERGSATSTQWALQVGLSAAAAGWQIISVAEAAYTTALHFPGERPSAS